MKCFRYFISINGPSVHWETGGEGGCVYSGRRRGKFSQYCCQSVQYAVPFKGWTGWSEIEVGGREEGGRYYQQSLLCISRCYRRYGQSAHHPR